MNAFKTACIKRYHRVSTARGILLKCATGQAFSVQRKAWKNKLITPDFLVGVSNLSEKILDQLIRLGASVNFPGEASSPALWCALYNNPGFAVKLIDRGAKVGPGVYTRIKLSRYASLDAALVRAHKRQVCEQCIGLAKLDMPVLVMVNIATALVPWYDDTCRLSHSTLWVVAKYIKHWEKN